MNSADVTDGDLVRAAVAGDAAAWKSLVERHGGRLWAIARSYRLDAATAADAVQTAWMNLLSSLSMLREPDSVGPWLNRVVSHEALRLKRRAERENPSDEIKAAAVEQDVTSDVVRQQQLSALRDVLPRLSEQCRRLLHLLFNDNPLSYADISEVLGVPIGSIGPTRGRCLAELRDLVRSNRYFARGSTPGLTEDPR